MQREMDEDGFAALKEFEAYRSNAYLDGGRVWTIGYGHTGGVHRGQVCNRAQAESWLRADVATAEDAVNSHVKVELAPNQFNALVIFTYNVGNGVFAKSTLLKVLNRGDYAGVPHELMKYVNIKGKRSDGLVNRRSKEVAIWTEGGEVAASYDAVDPATVGLVTPENVSAAVAGSATIFGALSPGSPLTFAVAAVIILAGIAGVYFVFKRLH